MKEEINKLHSKMRDKNFDMADLEADFLKAKNTTAQKKEPSKKTVVEKIVYVEKDREPSLSSKSVSISEGSDGEKSVQTNREMT